MKAADFKDLRSVEVFKNTLHAGTLSRTQSGSSFEYARSFLENRKGSPGLEGIAFNIGITPTKHVTSGINLHPFFAGLLPEGLRFTALRRALKTSEDDLFTLLAALGTDVVGDISISFEDLPAKSQSPKPYDFDAVTFAEVFAESLIATAYDLKHYEPAVPGVQAKVSAGRITLPVGVKKRKHQYILKLSSKNYPQLIENEHFFMTAALESGLEVAPVVMVHDKTGAPGLLVERFDRRLSKASKTSTRIHQEDACQFLNLYPADKYRLRCDDIVERMREICTAPDVESAKLIRLVAFSYLIGNGDLHGKNISLLLDPETRIIRLTPAYDLLSTLPYGDREMALDFHGRKRNLKRKHFIEFGGRFGVKIPVIDSILEEVVEPTDRWFGRLEKIGLHKKKLIELRKTILERKDLLGLTRRSLK